uniref:ANK_REP_REGION domain-containing protein n=1 Tax=Macrostomum lignano TaxID=282301 RepID=A0A1I8HW51_9PLAT
MLLKQHMSIQIRAMEHRDISGMTCLLIAAEQGHPMLFEHLLKFKADFTAKDSIGRNALMLSVGGGHRDIAKKILDKGLDVNATDVNQNTALHYACKHPDPVSCLDFLLEHGAKLQQNGIEETPLDVALMNQNERAIQLFLSEK